MNIRVVDEHNRTLAQGRDLTLLKRKMRLAENPPAAIAEPPAAGGIATVPANGEPLHRQWDFGELPETRLLQRNGLQLTVHPTLEDRRTGVVMAEARTTASSQQQLRDAVTRLALLALPQQVKYWQKRVADDRELVLASGGLQLAQPLAAALTQRIFQECFAAREAPPPRSREAFIERLEQGRARLEAEGGRVLSTTKALLGEWRAARLALDAVRAPSASAAVADVNAQLTGLLPPDFIETMPRPWFGYLPRYLKAAARRLSRLPADVRRDAELAARVRPFTDTWRLLQADRPPGVSRPELDLLRWMIEELRVSFYAQDLRTAVSVSERRLNEQAGKARVEANTA